MGEGLGAEARQETIRRYADVHSISRATLPLKWLLGRFDLIERIGPSGGTIVDLGCGVGYLVTYLALASEGRTCAGVDISDRKLSVAREATRGLWRVSFHNNNLFSYAVERADCFLILDTLHYFDRATQTAAFENCYKQLSPGGKLVMRNIDRRPRWTFVWNYAHEWLMTRFQLTATQGATGARGGLFFLDFEEYRRILEGIGFTVEILAPETARPYAVTMLVATRE